MQKLKIGDYVVATKYSDGSGKDPFCIGFVIECHFGSYPLVSFGDKTLRVRRWRKITPGDGKKLVKKIKYLEQFEYIWPEVHRILGLYQRKKKTL